MLEKIKENFKGNKGIVSLIIGVGVLLIVIFGASFAYFSVTSSNNASATNVQGSAVSKGNATLTTNTSNLYSNLNAVLMSKDNIGTLYYATTDSKGVPIVNATEDNGIYTLATASVNDGETAYNCSYKYKITATLNIPITDGSDEDIKLKLTGSSISSGSVEYTLKELLSAGATGIELTGTFNNLKPGEKQIIQIQSTTENTAEEQNDFAGNKYTITINPVKTSDGFACEVYEVKEPVGLAKSIIETGDLWQSGLEGDGYRFVGGISRCSYGDGQRILAINSDGNCPILYNYTKTMISSGYSTSYEYEDFCPPNDETYVYDCQEVVAENIIKNSQPNNYVCFGTTDKATCTENPNIYMYRIIGVFSGDAGNQHTKLVKYSSLPNSMQWNDSNADVDWENATLNINLNSSSFLTNTTYIPNATWSDKIANWKWTAVNTLYGSGGPKYLNDLSPSDIYLHEMNMNSKTHSIGIWTYPTAKIGLIYESDYTLSTGQIAKKLTSGSSTNREILKSGWIFFNNNINSSGSEKEWTISRVGKAYDAYHVWFVNYLGYISFQDMTNNTLAVRPTFYLNSDVELESGSGTISDPYIIKE